MFDKVEPFISAAIEAGWSYAEIEVALEDEYGMSAHAAMAALDTYFSEDDE